MRIKDLEHNYDRSGSLYSIPEGFEITEHQDYTRLAQETVFESYEESNYGQEELLSGLNVSIPDQETIWIAEPVINEHYIAETSLDLDAVFIVKNTEEVRDSSEENIETAETFYNLASLLHGQLDFNFPEIRSIPFEENNGDYSEAIRFIPNIAAGDAPEQLSSNQKWIQESKKSLHDLFVFNYWTDTTGDSRHNFGYTPSGEIAIFDYHKEQEILKPGERTSRFKPMQNTSLGDIPLPFDHLPKYTEMEEWQTENFREAVNEIQNLTDKQIEEAVGDQVFSPEALKQRRDVLDEVMLDETVWEEEFIQTL